MSGESNESWRIFGVAPDGTVDIVDQQRDILDGVPRVLAEKIIAAHNAAAERLCEKIQEVTGGSRGYKP